MRPLRNRLLGKCHGLDGGFGAGGGDSSGARDRCRPSPKFYDAVFGAELSKSARGTPTRNRWLFAAAPVQSDGFSPRTYALLRVCRESSNRRVRSFVRGVARPNRWPPPHASLRQRAFGETTSAWNACSAKLLISARRKEPGKSLLSQSCGPQTGSAPPPRRFLVFASTAR